MKRKHVASASDRLSDGARAPACQQRGMPRRTCAAHAPGPRGLRGAACVEADRDQLALRVLVAAGGRQLRVGGRGRQRAHRPRGRGGRGGPRHRSACVGVRCARACACVCVCVCVWRWSADASGGRVERWRPLAHAQAPASTRTVPADAHAGAQRTALWWRRGRCTWTACSE
jgi:hypothetical protein